MKSPVGLLIGFVLAGAAIVPASEAKVLQPVEIALNVSLACQIEQQKVLAITNTSGQTIPAGTHISYSFVRSPDHSSFSGYLSGGNIVPGQVIRKGIVPAYSCKAWFRRQPVLSR